MNGISVISEILASVFWVFVIFFFSLYIINKNIENQPYYKYYKWGIGLKILGLVVFNLIYFFYYGDGDTFYYFRGTETLYNLAFKDFGAALRVLSGEHSAELLSKFDHSTGWPTYYKDPNSWSVCRFMILFNILGFHTFWGTTLVMNFFLFSVIWNFYKMLNSLYPEMEKQFAIGIFFFPSVFVWSSGILKDIWCMYAVFALFYNFWKFAYRKEKTLLHILKFIFWFYILISIRPFMLYATLVSLFVWIALKSLNNWENRLVRVFIFPLILALVVLIVTIVVTQLSSIAVGKYSTIDSMLNQAYIIQDDLTRSTYGENSFDIGDFDPTIAGTLKKAPQALVAGFFRPFLWDGFGILTKISGIENLILLLFTILIIFKTKVVHFFGLILKEPFIVAIFSFSFVFAFMVGLTTANFGALVRYKIPVIPILYISLAFLNSKIKEETN